MKKTISIVSSALLTIPSEVNSQQMEVTIEPTVELKIETREGFRYDIEESTNLSDFQSSGTSVQGTGNTESVYFPIETKKFFRAIETQEEVPDPIGETAFFDENGNLRTGPLNTNPLLTPPGGLRIPAHQRMSWENFEGETAANVWLFPNHGSSHDTNFYPELVWASPRHCFYWDDGFQMGNSTSGPGQRGFRFLYFNPLGRAKAGSSVDTTMESIAVQFGGSWWNAETSQPVNSNASIQYVPTGVAEGKLGFWIGNASQPGGVSALGRILASSGHVKSFDATKNGISFPTGKGLYFADGSSITTAADLGRIPGIDSETDGQEGVTFTALIKMPNLPVFADNDEAVSLSVGTVYRTPTGDLKVRY
ncbi:MAG: hypothetical protein ACSHX9_05145 [Luteolibacter sp.]